MASLKEVKGRISSINGTLKITLRTKTASHADQLLEFGAECRVAFHCET